MSCKRTKGQKLRAILLKRRMTTLEMIVAGGGVCPWKRVREALEPGERMTKERNRAGLFVHWIVKGRA